MIIKQRNLFILLILVIMTGFVTPAFADDGVGTTFDTQSRERIRQAITNQQIRIMPQLNKLNFGFGQHDGIDYYFTKTISRIFFQDLQVEPTITGVQFDDYIIKLELSHPILGYGEIDFVFSPPLLKRAGEAEITKILLNALGDENHLSVFANTGGKIVHLFTCNHLRDRSKAVRMTLEYSEKKRYKRCNFCFKKMMYLPDLSLETAIEKEWSQRTTPCWIALTGKKNCRKWEKKSWRNGRFRCWVTTTPSIWLNTRISTLLLSPPARLWSPMVF
jgi:hypothetical protein